MRFNNLLIILVMILALPTFAQSANKPDWAVRCETEGDKRCYLVQNVFLDENKQRLATLAFSRQGQNYFALVSAPLGVNLPAGAQIEIDDASPLAVVYQMCNAQGCHGGLAVPQPLLKSLQHGKKLTVNYQDPAGRHIGVPFSLKDFNRGLETLNTTLGRKDQDI
jgi:invasion protein IalB